MAFSNEDVQEIKEIVLETIAEESDPIEDVQQVSELSEGDEVPIVRSSQGVNSYGRAPVNLFGGGGGGQGTVKGAKVGSGTTINPDANGIVTLPNYTENATPHIAPTSAEVKSALGTGSGTTKYLREDGTWQVPDYADEHGYVNVEATSSTTSVTEILPVTGDADTVYRVGCWDGTQYDATVYSEYAWNGNGYVHLSTRDYGMDNTPTPQSVNMVNSGSVYEFGRTNFVSNLKDYCEISGYIASSSHFQHLTEGSIVYDDSGTYLFTNLIKLVPNTYRITTGCSTNAIAISEFDSNGNFIRSLYDGEGNTAKSYILNINDTKYIRIVRHKDIPIEIDMLNKEFSYSENGNLFRHGYIASNTNGSGYSEGTVVGFDIEDVYVFSEPMILTPGLYLVKSSCSSSANVLSKCNVNGGYTECLIKGDGRIGDYYVKIQNPCYAVLSGNRSNILSIEPVDNKVFQVDGCIMHYGYIQTSGNIVTLDEPNPDGNFYYLYSDLIVLEKGEIIKANLKASSSVSVISKWTWNNQFSQSLVAGNGDENEYVYQATERMCIKLCTRSDIKIRIERVTETAHTENLGIIPIAWNWGYVKSDGSLYVQDFPDYYRYSQIVTLKAGFRYRISLKCSSSAIAISKWVNGQYDSNIFYGSYADRYYGFEITPDADIDVRFCGREITDENTVLWFQSTYADPLAGKAVNFLGDSYVANHELNFADAWQYKMCKEHHMTGRNYGINGNGIVAGSNPMVSRYTSMSDDADYVIVVGGKNDYNYQLSISEFKSGLATLINGLIDKYVQRGTKIGFFTPWRVYTKDSDDPQPIKLQQYVDAMVEVCNQYSVPIFDSSRRSSVFMFNQAFRTAYCQNSSDISHLNAAGHDYFRNKAEDFVKSL